MAKRMKIPMRSTKKTNEPWRRVRRMRSKLGNIIIRDIIELNVVLMKPRHVMLVVKGRKMRKGMK